MIADYAGFFAALGVLSSFIGQTAINYIVKKYNKRSYIILSIVIIIGSATILLTITGLMRFVARVKSGGSVGFVSLCS